jgi:ATP-dependent Clp protease ATP-binding subunit ClpA
VVIELTDAAREWLAKEGYDPVFGARPLARVIQDRVKKALAEELLFGKLAKGGVVRVDFKDGEPTFSFQSAEGGKKRRKGRKPSKDTPELVK